ncbi:MAG: carboxypeptidase-like regulatory domain-containing protein [Saprospiraceae bacterium]
MANGTVTLNAEYFNNASLDNCSQNANLDFSFSVDIADSLMTFTCAEVGINSVTMWVTDEIGNSDRCQTFIDIQDNMGVCPSNKASIAGSIKNPSGAGVSNVTVHINGGASMSQNTSNSGAFEFENLTR